MVISPLEQGGYMKRKITINKSTSKTINGRLNIPIKLLEAMGITEKDRDVVINLEGNKLIIEKAANNMGSLVEIKYVDITDEERKYLLW